MPMYFYVNDHDTGKSIRYGYRKAAKSWNGDLVSSTPKTFAFAPGASLWSACSMPWQPAHKMHIVSLPVYLLSPRENRNEPGILGRHIWPLELWWSKRFCYRFACAGGRRCACSRLDSFRVRCAQISSIRSPLIHILVLSCLGPCCDARWRWSTQDARPGGREEVVDARQVLPQLIISPPSSP
jgi:hypothetical protein